MDQHNYLQPWGLALAQAFRSLWNGTLTPDDSARLLDPALIFHFHTQLLQGPHAYRRFIDNARAGASGLDVAEELVLARDDLVMLIYRWTADGWHPDIVGGGRHSNYCKVVLRMREGRISEIWQQSPDFLYLLGKLPLHAPMYYPQVVLSTVLACEDGAIRATDDAATHAMSTLFQRMNDCFLNRSSLRNMQDIQNHDIRYDTGGMQGQGVQSWKTFVYALHTCLGGQQGTRFDDLYVRDGERLRVFLRATVTQASPYILRCADGLLAAMKMQVRDGRIAAIETRLENYIQFLDTDFTRHHERLANLFHGRREVVVEARPAAALATTTVAQQGVAIVGMAGRFPQCPSVERFWQALVDGRSLIAPLAPARPWLAQGTEIGHAGLIEDVDQFDTGYFQVLPDEARFIDPQQRLLLQEIVHSIEDSGHPAASYAGPRTALFIANLSQDYQKLLQEQGWIADPHTWAGNEQAIFAARAARHFDIQGPTRLVNAECTSSLVALHEAARLIAAGDVDRAIVGATNLLLHPYGFAARSGTLLTHQPQARLFAADSDGQLRGEAIVSVVLKSLAAAQADGDRIYGVIAGSAVNSSGKTLSLAAGHVERQADVMRAAWAAAGVTADDIALIECHASGVRGGDFAEIAALERAVGAIAGEGSGGEAGLHPPLRLGTSKAVTGHAEAASGIVSLVKVLMQLRHDRMLGVAGLGRIDPALRLDARRFKLTSAAASWPRKPGAARVAGINGFAAGGYNAHVVIREYLAPGAHTARRPAPAAHDGLVLISAQSQASLEARLRDLRDYLAARPQTVLADLSCTLRQRDALRWRAAFVPADVPELLQMLESALARQTVARAFLGRRDKPSGPVPADGEPLALAAAWAGGQNVAWPPVTGQQRERLADLPAYPFDTHRCWLPPRRTPQGTPAAGEAAASRSVGIASGGTDTTATDVGAIGSAAATGVHDAAANATITASAEDADGPASPTRSRIYSLSGSAPWLAGHVVQGRVLLPAVALLELARLAAVEMLQGPAFGIALRQVAWLRPVVCDTDRAVALRFDLTPLAAGTPLFGFTVTTCSGAEPLLHCQGQVTIAQQAPAPGAASVTSDPVRRSLEALRAVCTRPGPAPERVYAAYSKAGLDYGAAYRAVTDLHIGEAGEVLARLVLPEAAPTDIDASADGGDRTMALHPSMMDAAVHAAAALTSSAEFEAMALSLPFAVEQVVMQAPTGTAMWAWIRDAADSAAGVRVRKLDIDLFDDDGRLCVALSGLALRSVQGIAAASPAAAGRTRPVPSSALQQAVLGYLREEVAGLLHVGVDDISADEELGVYGFDSINLTSLGNRLNEHYRLPADRPLNPTIFFEYPTLGAFSQLLATRYPEQVAARHGVDANVLPAPPATATAAVAGTIAQHDQAGARTDLPPGHRTDAIAIVGISASLPQAPDLETFWHNLEHGRDCIVEVPPERWDWRALFGDPATEPFSTDVKWGGFMDGIADFDPLFFGISPREAELMDPQHRLLLQHAWHAIEEAGHDPRSLAGSRTGVFMATANSGYGALLAQAGIAVDGSTITGAVPSVAPNRISYLLDLHGPSEPVETACSSALVAIHRAMAAIAAGHCDQALVGAANTVVTPDGHIGFRKAGMLCADGRCKTFSREANGYVRGEGVGVLLLKPLAQAERDGDHVHAVLRGSAENHGGRANSLTAPNPNAQAQLIASAYEEAGVDPRTVGYIEAHGTGTALGDPVEINGLKLAFARLYARHGAVPAAEPHCGLGSVKSNIGHLELAAGMAGVLKVLLQLRHRTLAPTLHAQELNPYLELEGSPFFVVREGQPWKAPQGADGRHLPRRAGVSSFGFGGANAHVVLEEYRAVTASAASAASSPAQPYAIVLSARTATQLRDAAGRLRSALDRFGDDDLPAIAFTLQTGREAMVQRLALVCSSLAQLRGQLEAVIEGRAAAMPDVYLGAGKGQRDAIALFQSDDEWRPVLADWLARGKYRQVLPLWVHGLALDWSPLYANGHPRRVSLPGYPFARDRHWAPPALPAAVAQPAALHPLLHENISGFDGLCYRSTLTGNDWFLRDHVVFGRCVLPGVACLEMARAALALAMSSRQAVMLRDVTWLQPIALDAHAHVDARAGSIVLQLTLARRADGEVAFAIVSDDQRVHCQGLAALVDAPATAQPERLDVPFGEGGESYTASQIYERFAALGIDYGPCFRVIRSLRVVGEGAAMQVQAALQLPPAAAGGSCVLHPAMLDGALQAGVGFIMAQTDGSLQLPFHLRRLEVLAPCTASMQAVVCRTADDDRQDVTRLDVALYDEGGALCVRMTGFASRQAAQPPAQARVQRTAHDAAQAQSQAQALLMAPVWERLAPAAMADARPCTGERVWLLADACGAGTADVLQAHWPQAIRAHFAVSAAGDDAPAQVVAPALALDHIVWAAADCQVPVADGDAMLAAQEAGVVSVFRALKALLEHGYDRKPLAWTFITTGAAAYGSEQSIDPTNAGVRGLAGVLAREYPQWAVRVLDLAPGWSADAGALRTALALPAIDAVVRDGACWQQRLAPLQALDRAPAPRPRTSCYRSGGVYVVIGGAGGIGALWTDYMMRHYGARVVWIGRRARDAGVEARLAELAHHGSAPPPLYLTADAGDRESLAAARLQVLAHYGRIDGLVHAAAVLADASLAKMDLAELRAVYASKADTSVRMAQVFAGDRLDFVLCCSSLVAYAHPPGQANYVAGCVFQDAWARAMASHWSCPVKVINWGYWGGVGLAADEGYRQRMARLGVGSIESAEGMEALELLLADTLHQAALVKVTLPLSRVSQGIYAGVLPSAATAWEAEAAAPGFASIDGITPAAISATAAAPATATISGTQPADEAGLRAIVTGVLSAALKVAPDDIDPDEPFTAYGVDSITGVQLAQNLNQRLGLELDVTLFFDHGTVRRLAQHLLQRHGATLAAAPVQQPQRVQASVSVAQAPGLQARTAYAAVAPTSAHQAPGPQAPTPQAPGPQAPGSTAPVPQALPLQPAAHASAPAAAPIAIVGLSAAFPQADGPEALWQALAVNRSCVTEVPKQRWDWEQVGDGALDDTERARLRWGAFLDGVDRFDAAFFGIGAEEAACMSPQQRLLLTHAWRAVEDAGIAPATLAQLPTGVFVASVPTEYLNLLEQARNVPHVVTGLSTSMIPNRISQYLNLHGPSEHCDTACSSTLVALHRAVQAIRNGECAQALVGAVNLLLTPAGYIGFQSMGYLSPAARMAPFEPQASGFVRAESVGAVLLKPLQQAQADGDQVYGVIRGTGVAHGGGALSLTTPNGAGMRQAIRQALGGGGVDPASVAYIEAHGIASPLGDAIELAALADEYGRDPAGAASAPGLSATSEGAQGGCRIGTARPTVGYAEVASGLVSLVKVLMALRHRTLPGMPDFAGLHANLAAAAQRFSFSAQAQPWPASVDRDGAPAPRRAAINNFGFSGVNAHLVLEEYLPPPHEVPAGERQGAPELVVLSARSAAALRQSAAELLAVLRAGEAPPLGDVAFTLQTGRTAFTYRLAVCVDSVAGLAAALDRFVGARDGKDDHDEDGGVITGHASARNLDRREADQWARQGRLHELARYWVDGGAVDWRLLRPEKSARRVSLPGHPLSPQSHWVAGATGLSPLHGRPKAGRAERSGKRSKKGGAGRSHAADDSQAGAGQHSHRSYPGHPGRHQADRDEAPAV